MSNDTKAVILFVALLLILKGKGSTPAKAATGGMSTTPVPGTPQTFPSLGSTSPAETTPTDTTGPFGGDQGGNYAEPVNQNNPTANTNWSASVHIPAFPAGAPVFNMEDGRDYALVSPSDPSIRRPELCTQDGDSLLCPIDAF